MENPFLKEGCLGVNSSINKIVIKKMPKVCFSDDFTEKTALEIFSTELFIKEIKKYSNDLKLNLDNINEKMLPQYLNKCLESTERKVRECAESIVMKFGRRLGVILLVLKQGEKENRDARSDWGNLEWDYYNSIDNVILCGGLASSNIGKLLKYHVEEVFKYANEKAYNIILINDSSNAAIKGCASCIKNTQRGRYYLIFDCGQSFIKRSVVRYCEKDKYNIINLNKIASTNVGWNFNDINQEKEEALKLHENIINTIIETIDECENEFLEIGNEIVLSIANYVKNGVIVNRGGYGKLRLLGDNYEKYLCDELFKRTGRKFKIKLLHDGTSMAKGFPQYKNSVCISLGTAFGVGFTE